MCGVILASGLVWWGIVDRIEGAYAVVEWEVSDRLVFQDLPLVQAPRKVREGVGLRLELPPECGGEEGFLRFLREEEACGGRASIRIAPLGAGPAHHDKTGGWP